ncbi:MAG: AMIN-like domain-containing (lipo)protein, partial [Pseudonocardiaceae bacterium]
GSQGDDSGHQPDVVFAPNGARLHGPGGLENWGCLREVRSAGSFEGQTTFAIGTRDKLPFRVDTWTDPNQTTHVTVDIACQ